MAETAFFAPKLYKGTAGGAKLSARSAGRSEAKHARSKEQEEQSDALRLCFGHGHAKTPLICGICSKEMAVCAISTCK